MWQMQIFQITRQSVRILQKIQRTSSIERKMQGGILMPVYNLGTVVGNGITGIEKISSENNVDTYRINFTDGTHFDYEVTSADIEGIQDYIDNLIGNIEDDMMD